MTGSPLKKEMPPVLSFELKQRISFTQNVAEQSVSFHPVVLKWNWERATQNINLVNLAVWKVRCE
jgi:exopolysaccharide biosynthesis protein